VFSSGAGTSVSCTILSKGQVGRPMKDPQKQRIRELEEQLADAKLKVLAYEKLIAITEQEENIVILKKGATGR